MKLIIQIPAYNEEGTIARTIDDLPKRVAGVSSIEILVIDDGSSDGTVVAAKRAGAHHVIRLLNHRGLATAFKAGIEACLAAGADVIVNTDADHQYQGADIQKLVDPILRGDAEVVIGDRQVSHSAHMGPIKRLLQKVGSWAVGVAAGKRIPDVTSGFRAFSREAALQLNVFNPFTYTLETIIQAGQRNLSIVSVPVGTNAPTRPSRLYRGSANYIRKSVVTIFRIYALYRPLKTFFAIGVVLFLAGFLIGSRFVVFYLAGEGGGHVQSLILASILLIIGFQTMLISLLADLISVNRRLSEEVLLRLRRAQLVAAGSKTLLPKPRREPRPAERTRTPVRAPSPSPKPAEPQWVWLMDEEEKSVEPAALTKADEAPRRRRRRRGGTGRHFSEAKRHHRKEQEEKSHDTPSAETPPE